MENLETYYFKMLKNGDAVKKSQIHQKKESFE